MMHPFIFLSDPPSPADWNMAVDQTLMESKQAYIRFYKWKNPSLSLGYFQPIDEINLPYIQENSGKIDLVRRITGGKAVLHQHELTYSISAPVTWFPGALRNSYSMIAKGLQKGLEELGLVTNLLERAPDELTGGNCFQSPGWFEILHKDKKLVGSAQIRRKGRLLQHGSILLDKDIPLIRRLFKHEAEEALHSISIKEISGKTPEDDKLVYALISGLQESLNAEIKPGEIPEEYKEKIVLLQKERYGNDSWTLRR